MFRKIHSNRDPSATLYSEIKKEFAPYFERVASKSKSTLHSHPKPFYWVMILLLLFSAALSFVFRTPPTAQKAIVVVAPARKPSLNDGFDRILYTGAALKRTLQLKSEVDAITNKGKLDHADSLALESALDSLGQLHKQINH